MKKWAVAVAQWYSTCLACNHPLTTEQTNKQNPHQPGEAKNETWTYCLIYKTRRKMFKAGIKEKSEIMRIIVIKNWKNTELIRKRL